MVVINYFLYSSAWIPQLIIISTSTYTNSFCVGTLQDLDTCNPSLNSPEQHPPVPIPSNSLILYVYIPGFLAFHHQHTATLHLLLLYVHVDVVM